MNDPMATLEQARDAAVTPPEPAAQEPPEPAVPEVPSPPPAPPPAAAEPVHPVPMVEGIPLPKYLELRDRERAIRAENERMRRELEERSRAPQQVPDPLVDPDGYRSWLTNYVNQQIQQLAGQSTSREMDQRFNMSEMIATQTHGKELVEEAYQAYSAAIAQDPRLFERFRDSRHPWDDMVKWHQQTKLLGEFEKDPDAYIVRRYNELLAEGKVPGATPAHPGTPDRFRDNQGRFAPAPATPPPPGTAFRRPSAPPSLNGAPSAGQNRHTGEVGPDVAFATTFGR